MRKQLYRNLNKFYYIETELVDKIPTFTAWYARFVTIPFFGIRVTIIYGLDFMIFEDIIDAQNHINMQKYMYKYAVNRRYKK